MTQLDTFSHARSSYDLVAVLFVALLLISSVATTKLIAFGPEWPLLRLSVLPIITDGGVLLFPLAYVLGDVLAEVFGMRGTRRAILLGLGISLFASLTLLAVDTISAVPGCENQEAFAVVLGFIPRIVVASLAGYLVRQFLNTWVLVKLEQWRKGKGMWERLPDPTMVGEAADTTTFCLTAFGGQINGGTMLNYIVVGYLSKVGVEAVLLPVAYRVISLVHSHESEPIKVRRTTLTQALKLPELLILGAQMSDSTRPNPFQ